jgi:hypothetical protein
MTSIEVTRDPVTDTTIISARLKREDMVKAERGAEARLELAMHDALVEYTGAPVGGASWARIRLRTVEVAKMVAALVLFCAMVIAVVFVIIVALKAAGASIAAAWNLV